jgi:hypothetical protein
MNRNPLQIGRVAVGEHRHHSVDEVLAIRKILGRVPAKTIRRKRIRDRPGGEQLRAFVTDERRVVRGWPHPVQPAAPVLVPGHRESRARQLFGVKAECGLLRRVAALGERIRRLLFNRYKLKRAQLP